MAGWMTREEFEDEVDRALAALPSRFQEGLENLAIVVEGIPDAGVARRVGTRAGGLLLGLYEGIPLPKRGSWYGTSPVMPDRITLFQDNLERVARNRRELREQIHDTLIHEIGHYYGMTEREIRDAGY